MIVSTAAFPGVDPAASQILCMYRTHAPVDVVAIAVRFGINVWESYLPEGISGKIFRDDVNGGASGFSIIVNQPEPLVRKRFTLAHEIAHFLLHRHQFGRELMDDALYRSGLGSAMESQANRLAAEILMPRELLGRLIDSGVRDIGTLATELQVSEVALKIRLGIPA